MEYLFHPTQDNIVLHQLHFIIPTPFTKNQAKKEIKKALKKFNCKSGILSRIRMSKENCITKEKYEKMYKTNEESEKRMDLSVGEDLETFIGRIKNGEINKDTFPKGGEYKRLFLLCLLDKEERKKLEQKDNDFMETFLGVRAWGQGLGSGLRVGKYIIGPVEVDVPEAEWKASESNMKFAESRCWRKTYFIDANYYYYY